jgi:hypothetical protein
MPKPKIFMSRKAFPSAVLGREPDESGIAEVDGLSLHPLDGTGAVDYLSGRVRLFPLYAGKWLTQDI